MLHKPRGTVQQGSTVAGMPCYCSIIRVQNLHCKWRRGLLLHSCVSQAHKLISFTPAILSALCQRLSAGLFLSATRAKVQTQGPNVIKPCHLPHAIAEPYGGAAVETTLAPTTNTCIQSGHTHKMGSGTLRGEGGVRDGSLEWEAAARDMPA